MSRPRPLTVGDDYVTVYVYRLRGMGPIPFSRSYQPPWFALTADTEDELHPFAETIGLYRHFYRPATSAALQQLPVVGHYDLDEGERYRAVANGAHPITWRQHDRMLRQRAER